MTVDNTIQNAKEFILKLECELETQHKALGNLNLRIQVKESELEKLDELKKSVSAKHRALISEKEEVEEARGHKMIELERVQKFVQFCEKAFENLDQSKEESSANKRQKISSEEEKTEPAPEEMTPSRRAHSILPGIPPDVGLMDGEILLPDHTVKEIKFYAKKLGGRGNTNKWTVTIAHMDTLDTLADVAKYAGLSEGKLGSFRTKKCALTMREISVYSVKNCPDAKNCAFCSKSFSKDELCVMPFGSGKQRCRKHMCHLACGVFWRKSDETLDGCQICAKE